MRTRHRNFIIKAFRMAAEFFDLAEPVLGLIADKLEKKSGSKHKKAFKKAKYKYLSQKSEE